MRTVAPPAFDLEKIAEFNRTDALFPDQATLQQLIEARVREHPERVAVFCDHDRTWGTASLTCEEMNAKANQLAEHLIAAGVASGDIVALLLERSFSMMISILAVLKAGAAYLPLAPDNPLERTAYMLRDANVSVVLVQAKNREKLSSVARTIDVEDRNMYSGSIANPRIVNTSRDLAYVIYTSGSTGKPKGVMVEHRSVVNRLHWMQQAYPIGESDVVLQKTPYYFDVSVWELFWWALQGAKVCFLAPGAEGNPLALIKTIAKRSITVMHFVPSMLSIFLEYLESRPAETWNKLASVKRVFASGEVLSPSHVRKFNELWGNRTGARLTNLYGPTETTVDVTYFDCPPKDTPDQIPIGRPIFNTKLYVVRDGQPVAIGETGELCIAGVGLARGYLNDPSLTAERFVDNPSNPGERMYRTGDLGRWLPDGNVEFLGREDQQVKIRGLRIELGEIEDVVRGFSGVTDCVAVVKKHTEAISLIIAYVTCKPGVNFGELRQHVKKHLPPYMVPNHFERLDRLPLTASGKADRKALPEPSM